MNQAQNQGSIVLPYQCVGFFPDDQEIIQEFLTPWIKKKLDLQASLIQPGDLYPIISGQAGPWDIETYPYFRRNHYWFFVEREPVIKRGSGLVAERRVVGPEGNLLGTWKSKSSAYRNKIKKGRLVLGFKQTLEFITNNDLNSGWYQIEYTRYSEAFETTVVSHLVYDEEKDQVRQHENQENGNEDFVHELAHKIKTETDIKIETGSLAHKIKIETGALAGQNGFGA